MNNYQMNTQMFHKLIEEGKAGDQVAYNKFATENWTSRGFSLVEKSGENRRRLVLLLLFSG